MKPSELRKRLEAAEKELQSYFEATMFRGRVNDTFFASAKDVHAIADARDAAETERDELRARLDKLPKFASVEEAAKAAYRARFLLTPIPTEREHLWISEDEKECWCRVVAALRPNVGGGK
jgi:hypothetical protein